MTEPTPSDLAHPGSRVPPVDDQAQLQAVPLNLAADTPDPNAAADSKPNTLSDPPERGSATRLDAAKQSTVAPAETKSRASRGPIEDTTLTGPILPVSLEDEDRIALEGDAAYPHHSMAELASRGELPATKEGLTIALALRIGDLVLSNGMSTNDTVALMRRVFRAYDMKRVQVDITNTSIIVSYQPGGGLPPFTSMRHVVPGRNNLSQVTEVNRLVNRIMGGESLVSAIAQFDQIRAAPNPYPNWIAVLGASAVPMAVLLLYTTNPIILLLGLLEGLAINRLQNWLSRRALPAFFQQLAGGWLIVAVVAAMSTLGSFPGLSFLNELNPTLVAVGGIFQLVVGTKFVSAGQDAIDEFYVTAAGRLLQVIMLTGGIAAGLITGLAIVNQFEIVVYIAPDTLTLGAVPFQYLGVVLTAMFYVIGSFADGKTILLSGGISALAWFAYSTSKVVFSGEVLANFIGAFVGALAAAMLVRKTSVPGFAVITGGMISLVPGLRVYNGLIQLIGTNLIEANPSLAGSTLAVAAGVAIAIAAGASLGVYFGRPMGDRMMALPRAWYNKLVARSHRGH